MTKEQDKRIAVEVMCHDYLSESQGGTYGNGADFITMNNFNPTTDANDDCLVLKHIRENWNGSQLWIFDGMLISLWSEKNPNERDIELPKYYEKGDYSRTALKVLDGQKTDKKPLSE